MESLQITPVGVIRSNENRFYIQLDSAYIPALQALEGFSHMNVIWWFSDCDNAQCRSVLDSPKPYRNAPEIMGIFATRSPVRPNPIALSTAEILSIDHEKGIIELAYIDANDNTPLLDLKPYTPSLDRVEHPQVPAWCQDWPVSVETSGDFDWEHVFLF